MFKPLTAPETLITIDINQQAVQVAEHSSVAAALLAAGHIRLRQTALSDSARGPFCMIGNCFDCLVTIDGKANQQACRIRVTQGMQISFQQGLPDV